MVKRYHVIAEGQVQGVGFRGFVILQASRRKLTGSVRNLTTGMVEIFVQGEENAVNDFLSAVEKGNQFIKVSSLSVKPTPVKEGEKSFGYGG